MLVVMFIPISYGLYLYSFYSGCVYAYLCFVHAVGCERNLFFMGCVHTFFLTGCVCAYLLWIVPMLVVVFIPVSYELCLYLFCRPTGCVCAYL